ncbi:MAG: beta-N-acetylhexosaminidase [Acetobacteraceae bacterium]|nr:beta-N-acetylhexosaminidase [Acetobacteraceae bacterium]
MPKHEPTARAAIVGIEGPSLRKEERALFRAYPPAGVILFRRNVDNPRQLRLLNAELRAVLGAGAVLMVDQEGGRVARLRPPYWRSHPAPAVLGALFEQDRRAGLRAAWLTGALIGCDCVAAGFDVACAPVLDLRYPGAHAVIGDRAFGGTPLAVARLGRAYAAGLLAAGIQPVAKHAPGHGRAEVDSHLALPRVEATDRDADLLPFALNTDIPWVMTAHILYRGWDSDRPATLSPVVVAQVIRGRIGFRGVLVTDDLAMHALSGAPHTRARDALAAGCELALYGAGTFEPTAALLRACPALSHDTRIRLAAARHLAGRRRLALEPDKLAAERAALLADKVTE